MITNRLFFYPQVRRHTKDEISGNTEPLPKKINLALNIKRNHVYTFLQLIKPKFFELAPDCLAQRSPIFRDIKNHHAP